jgi:mRNA interferase MazF
MISDKMQDLFLGTIVLMEFPFTDGQNSKKRPALIICDSNDGDIIVCRITSKIYKTPWDIEIKSWEKFGLKLPSVVRLHKIATLEKHLIHSILGELDSKYKNKITAVFKKLIDKA